MSHHGHTGTPLTLQYLCCLGEILRQAARRTSALVVLRQEIGFRDPLERVQERRGLSSVPTAVFVDSWPGEDF